MPGTPANAQFDPQAIPMTRPATPVRVFRREGTKYKALPWIDPIAVESETEGPEPGMARFRYVFRDQGEGQDVPSRFDEVFPLDATGDFVVRNDDEIVVFEYPDGKPELVFHGFANVPELALNGETQEVTFQAQGYPVREFGEPVRGPVYRDSDKLDQADDFERVIDRRVHFNPGGQPNCTPEPDSGDASSKHPVFMDHRVVRTPDVRRPWDLAKAVRYLLAEHNTGSYVESPDFDALTQILENRRPKEGESSYNPDDPGTYDADPIAVQDVDVTGLPWPLAVHRLLEPHGFGMVFRHELDRDDQPRHFLEIYRKDADGLPVKDLFLQAPNQPLRPELTNVGSAHITRDFRDVANQIRVMTEPTLYEASFVLAPLFRVAAADAGNVAPYTEGNPGFAGDNLNKYRAFGIDEAGDGHWDFDSNSWKTEATELPGVLPTTGDGEPEYAKIRRPPQAQLLTKDPSGKPLRAEVWVSTDYTGGVPGPWDPDVPATWQRFKGSYRLLEDRLGIYVTEKNPDDLNIGKGASSSDPFPSGKVRLVKSTADPDAQNPRLVFRLTCVIQGDDGLDVLAEKRPSSPTKWVVERMDDMRDRFRKGVITERSHLRTGAAEKIAFDDTDRARAYASQRQLAHEIGPTTGPVLIPRLVHSYSVGDRIRGIAGRNCSFAANAGSEDGEAPRYPSVVKVSRSYNPQGITLHLSDRRGEPRSPTRWKR